MIKRRYYRTEHGEKDDASDSSSSSSSDDSEVEAQASEDDDSDDDVNNEVDDDVNDEVDDEDEPSTLKPRHASISPSGYESEDSSENEIDADSTGLITRDDDSESESDRDLLGGPISRKQNGGTVKTSSKDHPVADNVPSCVLQSKAVYKCRLCPKIVCLNEESLMTHLKSKRHSRSEKLLNEGRLKRFLNSDGEEEVVSEDDGETHAERHARIIAMAQDTSKKKGRGRQRQRQRLKRKKQNNTSDVPSSGQQRENRAKRRKNVD